MLKTNMKLLQAIEIKFLGATNTKGSRIKLTDLRFNKSKTLSYDHEYSISYEQAYDYLISKGFNPVCYAEGKNGMYIIFINDFKELV